MSIEVRRIQKHFDKHVALRNIDLKVESGEMIALLGPSGSGKTTLLRVIAGLEPADSGQVLFHGEDVHDQCVGDRRVGFVFQHYALFRHMCVFENVAFGLRCRPWKLRPSRGEIREKVTELLRLVQLENFARRLPTQLSGGQRQRVALARALAIEPRVLLLDEPFGALDAQVRRELRGWIRRLHDRLGFTSIFVTHDQEEALEIADRIVVMRAGAIEQIGTPDEVYEHPATSFVFQFLGDVNLFHGRLNDKPAQYVRPHDVHVSRDESPDAIPATVERVRRAGAVVHIDLRSQADDKPIVATLARDRFAELALTAGELVRLQLNDVRVYQEEYSI